MCKQVLEHFHFTNVESRLPMSFTCVNEERIDIVQTNHVQTSKCTLQTRKDRCVTVLSASKSWKHFHSTRQCNLGKQGDCAGK